MWHFYVAKTLLVRFKIISWLNLICLNYISNDDINYNNKVKELTMYLNKVIEE